MIRLRVDDGLDVVPWRPEDADAMFAAVDRNRAHLRRWLPWLDHVKTVDDERAFIARANEQAAANNGFHAGIWRNGNVVGGLGFHYVDWANRKTELGYWVDEREQGKGVVTRSCHAALAFAFGEWKLNRIVIFCATANARSRAVPERLGFTLEGVYRQPSGSTTISWTSRRTPCSRGTGNRWGDSGRRRKSSQGTGTAALPLR